MNAVGKLGSYITRSVYTVSGPFHPFGGAVDIIVVEQPDGSFKSSPWYVRFGKFQGVLRAREKVVNISVNGVDADFHMYLDQRGQAYFLRELEGESVSSSSGDEADEQSKKGRRPMKSKSCNYDGKKFSSGDQIDERNGKIVTRSNSRRSRILGLVSVFGRRSVKEDGYLDENDGSVSSLERAEIAANLLDVKWSTNLDTSKPRKDNTSRFSVSDKSDSKWDKDRPTNDVQSHVGLSSQDAKETSVDQRILAEETGSCDVQTDISSQSGSDNQESFMEEAMVEISSLGTTEQIITTFIMDETALKEELEEISQISRNFDEHSLQNDNAEDLISEVIYPDKKFDDEWVSKERNVELPGLGISEESGSDRVKPFIYCEKSENAAVELNGSEEQHKTTGRSGEVHFCAKALHATAELLPKVNLLSH